MSIRRIARGVAIALAILVATVAVAGLGGVLWLRSSHGRAFLLARLTGFVDGKIHGRLTVGRVEGPLWGWAVLKDVRLVDADGNEAARAAEIAVQFDPWAALPHRNHLHRLYIVDPVFQAEPLADGRLHLEVLFHYLRERQRSLRIDALVVLHARAHLPPLKGPLRQLDDARMIGRLFFVEHTRWGRVDLLETTGRMALSHGPPRPMKLDGTLTWDPQTRVAADGIHIAAGDSKIEGRVTIRDDRFDLDLTRLHVTARDFHQVAPVEDPPGDVDGQVAIHGTLRHLAIDLKLHPGDGSVHLRGHADWREKLLTVTIDHHLLRGAFFPKKPPFVIDARVQARVKYVGKGVVGPAVVENASGTVKDTRFEHGSASAIFFADGVDFARAAMDTPDGVVSGHAHITFHGKVQLEARLSRPHLTVEAKLDKERKRKAHWSVKAVGLGRPVERRPNGHPM